MGFPPAQSNDPYEQALSLLDGKPNVPSTIPSTSGLGSRQSQIRNERTAVFKRKMVHWLIPEGPLVQMYINPQNIKIRQKKAITRKRTKGGFAIQYWGEELIDVSISGTTGTSGIEGINVLNDVYRNEQLAFDPYALALAAQNKQQSIVGDIFNGEILGSLGLSGTSGFSGIPGISNVPGLSGGLGGGLSGLGGIPGLPGLPSGGSVFGLAEEASIQPSRKPPTLASMAMTVEMYWSGEVYRGFFDEFSVEESSTNIGMFDYNMAFVATQKRGLRLNFLAWHRSATSGPSNSDPHFGTPYSYKYLTNDAPSNIVGS